MKPQYLKADVANLLADINSLFSEYPELADDAELRADMLEGSTAAFDVLTRLVNIERDADSMSRAVAARISELQSRRAAAEKRKEAMRVLMLRVMRACGIQKAPLVEATVSISKGRDSVDVVDVNKLPKWAYVTERKPDKKAIMERLAAAKNVAGAALKTGEDTVVVRVA
jgi:hypothetical protein